MTTLNTQFGVVDESTYGTPVTVTRFYETVGVPDIELDVGMSQSEALRTGSETIGASKFVPYRRGAGGSVLMDVPTKGWGWWLKHMLGAVATVGPTDANYVHTGTVGSLLGDFFTAQVGKVFHPAGTVQPHTYHGGKVNAWELSCDVEGLLQAMFEMDFEDEDTSTGLASASYPSAATVFAWAGGAITIAGSSVELKNFKIRGENNFDVDRRLLRGSALKKEPTERRRTYSWEATAEFTDLTQYNRYVSATAAGRHAQIIATFDGPIAHGGSTLPQIVVTIPSARFDKVKPQASGDEPMEQALSGIATDDYTNSQVTVSYRSTDATP